jgi:hypothetical protein
MRLLPAATAILVLTATGAASASPAAPAAHYAIRATITPARQVLATVVITLPPDEVGREAVFALGDRFTLRRVDGGPDAKIHFEAANKPLRDLQKIIFDFDRAPTRPVTLTFVYEGPLAPPGDKNGVVTADMMELGLEEGWYPFRPSLDLQFTADTDIRGVPDAMTVVAQGQVRHRGARLTTHRATTDFDVPIAAVRGLKRATAPGFEIYATDLDDPFVSIYRKNAAPALAYYTALYGPMTAPAPIRMIVAPRGGGGYERRSFISTGDGKADLKANPHFDEFGPARHIAHEIAHAWWWDADSASDNYWLAESMAEYSALRWVRDAYGEPAFKTLLDLKREPAKKAGPVIGHGRPGSAALYQKGPLLLFALEARIGQPAMDRMLGALGRDRPHTTTDFLKALSAAAGPDAAAAFEADLRS